MRLRLLIIVVLIGLSIFINYIDRGNLATAATLVQKELHLAPSQLGFLLTAFFITYMPMQPLVGWLVDKYTASTVLVVGFFIWSLATLLSAFAAGFALLFACRLLLGLGESVSFPSMAKLLAENVSEKQRCFANGIIQAGLAFGSAFGIFVGSAVIAEHGWRPFFVGCGLLSMLWIVAWRFVSRGQLRKRSEDVSSAQMPAFGLILREPTLWGASLGHFGGNLVLYFTISWIPYYLVHERGWTISQMGLIAGSASLAAGMSMIVFGFVSDRAIGRGASPTVVRKAAFAIGGLGGAIALLGCGYSHGANASAAWLVASGFFSGFVGLNTYVVAQTKAGDATGRWVGIQNMLANAAGLIAPVLTGVLVEATGNFKLPFALAAVAAVGSALAWTLLTGKIEPIDWKARATARSYVPALVVK